jgi:diguanylate cyclase (GGDEF)-like protein
LEQDLHTPSNHTGNSAGSAPCPWLYHAARLLGRGAARAPRVGGRYYRRGIYALLLLVIGASVTLSLVTERRTAEIRRAATSLLTERIPQLRYLADFEIGVLRYQLALDKWYTRSISAERFVELERVSRAGLDAGFERMRRSQLTAPELDKLHAGYLRIIVLGSQFTRAMNDDPAAARRVLLEMNVDVKQLHASILELQRPVQDFVNASGQAASQDIDRLTRLVHLFNILTFLTSCFMLYHVWARVWIENELVHQARHDPLTGLAHRRSFEARLRSLPASPHTVVLGTIDRFARVIGGFGHAFGDRMVSGLAQRIRLAAERNGGEVYRLDGANFAILYKFDRNSVECNTALSYLQTDVRRPFNSDGREVFATLSLGTVNYPADGAGPDELLRNADAALQAALRAGGDPVADYSSQLNAQTAQRLDLEAQLRHAVARGELELHYQPQQALDTGALVGFEALIRWRRNGELVAPGQFIPLAEESGLIVAIGDWVLEEACRQLMAWDRAHPLTIAVNISPRQFAHPDFLSKIEALLARTGVDPARIELEITEGVMMEQAESAIVLLHRLRQLGLKLSIDDFGTGYSSLAYLRRFPVDKLKIDQSFVRQMQGGSEDAAIVQAVIGLGHTLGIAVIAEGVETAAQRELLHAWSCDQIQGYHYGRPLPAAETQRFIEQEETSQSSSARDSPVRQAVLELI